MKRIILFVLSSLMLSMPAYADVYRWVDENGVENFTDSEWNVPAKYRQKATVIREKKVAPPAEVPSMSPGKALSEPGKGQDELMEDVSPKGPMDNEGHDEAWWRARVDTLKKKKAELEKELAGIEEKLGSYGRQAVAKARGATPEQQQDYIDMAVKRDEIKKQLADIDYQLEVGLPDEARKAGALPGWLR